MVTMRKAETIPELAPRYDSNANGLAERGVQAAEMQLRSMKLALEERLGGTIPVQHPVVAWLLRHATDMTTKLEVKDNGKRPTQ